MDGQDDRGGLFLGHSEVVRRQTGAAQHGGGSGCGCGCTSRSSPGAAVPALHAPRPQLGAPGSAPPRPRSPAHRPAHATSPAPAQSPAHCPAPPLPSSQGPGTRTPAPQLPPLHWTASPATQKRARRLLDSADGTGSTPASCGLWRTLIGGGGSGPPRLGRARCLAARGSAPPSPWAPATTSTITSSKVPPGGAAPRFSAGPQRPWARLGSARPSPSAAPRPGPSAAAVRGRHSPPGRALRGSVGPEGVGWGWDGGGTGLSVAGGDGGLLWLLWLSFGRCVFYGRVRLLVWRDWRQKRGRAPCSLPAPSSRGVASEIRPAAWNRDWLPAGAVTPPDPGLGSSGT